jgi:hypothetical protein
MKQFIPALAVFVFLVPVRAAGQTNTVLVANTAGTPIPNVGAGYAVVQSQHVDVNVSYNTNNATFSLGFRNVSGGTQYTGTNAIAYAVTNQRTTIPSGSQWSFLGPVGGTFWYFPANASGSGGATSLKALYLGFAAYGVPANTFTVAGPEGEQVRLRVHSVENLTTPGSGEFFGYALSGTSPVFRLSSIPGYDNNYWLLSGGHGHLNLALTASGMFRIWFVVSGTLVSGGQTIESPPLPLYFGVEQWQIPSPSLMTYSAWRSASFSQSQASDPAISGTGADPDLDGFDNTEEYAFGGNPLVADAALISPRLQADGNAWLFTVRQRTNTSDLSISPQATANLQTGLAHWRSDLLTPHGPPRNVAGGIDEFDYLLDGSLTDRAFFRARTELTLP